MPAIPYLTLRVATMASEHFDVDRCLSLVKPQHAAFYKRVFDADTIVSPQKNCGNYKIDLTLLAARVREIRPWSLYAVSVLRSGTIRAAHDVRR